jgi:hypothetical protein
MTTHDFFRRWENIFGARIVPAEAEPITFRKSRRENLLKRSESRP